MIRPNVFDFESPSGFLGSMFEFKRQNEPTFTVRRWALQMGLRSPKPIFALLKGTREFKLKDLEFVLKGLDLLPREVRYFEALILWRKASPSEKPVLRALLDSWKDVYSGSALSKEAEANAPKFTVFESEDDELFSHWTDAALLSALRLKSVRSNLDLIHTNLLWEKDPGKIARSIEKIRRHRLVADNAQEGLKPKYGKITTSNDKNHKGGRAYYSQVNHLATQAVELPHEVREFQCFSIPARSSDAAEFKQLLRKFREDLAAWSNDDGDTVFQFNLEMFPLFKPIGAETDNDTDLGDVSLS